MSGPINQLKAIHMHSGNISYVLAVKHPTFGRKFLTVITKNEATGNGCSRYYADHSELGCGKSFLTREDAAASLVRDHGYTVLHMERA